jgi:hypothetical protein
MKVILFILFSLDVFAPRSVSDWKIYPNPAKTYFNISVSEGTLPAWVRVYDRQGRIVLLRHIEKNQTLVKININLKPGVYIVYLDNNK